MLGTLKQWKTLPTRITKLNATASKPSTEAGLTLLECLIAIAVIGITASLILPPLFLSAGTRVQNRRAEQAFQLAQEEINRLQTMAANEQHQRTRLPIVATTANVYFRNNQAASSIQNVQPPRGGWWQRGTKMRSTSASCNTYVPFNPSPNAAATPVDIVPLNQALAIDVDGNCQPDFFMQAFRDFGTYSDIELGASSLANPPTTARPTVFRAVVRIYSNVANLNNSWGSMATPVIPASLQFTRGEGNQRERPLAVMSSLITWSSTSFASCSLQYHMASENGQPLASDVTNRCRGDVAQIP